MRLNLLSASIIAVIAMAIIPMANIANAHQANPSKSPDSPVVLAARNEAHIFKLYVAFLVMAGLGTAIGTVLVWRANNKYLGAVNADAEVRLAAVQLDAKRESERIENEGKLNVARVESESKERIAKVESAANLKIADANERTATLAKQAADLKKQNLETEAKLESERQTRLELEKSVAPRIAGKIEGNTKFPALLAFSGMQVIVEYLPGDWEVRRAAGSLINVLELPEVGFKIIKVSTNPELEAGFFEGVTIFPCAPMEPITARPSPTITDREELALAIEKEREIVERVELEKSRCQRAAIAISDFLESCNWSQVKIFPTISEELPVNTIKISIGYKTSPYFLPPAIKRIMERLDQEEHKNKERQRELPPNQP